MKRTFVLLLALCLVFAAAAQGPKSGGGDAAPAGERTGAESGPAYRSEERRVG